MCDRWGFGGLAWITCFAVPNREHRPERDERTTPATPQPVAMTEFGAVARAMLAHAGLPYTEGDLELLAVVDEVLRPGIFALDQVDPRLLTPEHDLDPSRAPR